MPHSHCRTSPCKQCKRHRHTKKPLFCCVPGPRGFQGTAGGLLDYAEFYTKPENPDARPVPVGNSAGVIFSLDGVNANGGYIERVSGNTFSFNRPAIYRITWTVPVTREGQGSTILALQVGGVTQANTMTGLSENTILNTRTVLYRNTTPFPVTMSICNPYLGGFYAPVFVLQGVDGFPISSTLVIECLAGP